MGIVTPSCCRACGGHSFSRWGAKAEAALFQCSECDLVFFFPYPTEADLDRFYNGQYHSDRGYGGGGEAGELRRSMYALDVRDLEQTISQRGAFLDVGCAEGAFLSMLDSSWNKYGIDVSEPAVEKAAQRHGVNARVMGIADVEDAFFDVIHLRGVFEHILNPLEFLSQATPKLVKGGTLVLSNTPNIGGVVPRLFRGRFKLVLLNEHVNYFSINTIEALAQRTGLSVKAVCYPYFGTPYEHFFRDMIAIPWGLLTGKESPPFYGNIFTVYLEKE